MARITSGCCGAREYHALDGSKVVEVREKSLRTVCTTITRALLFAVFATVMTVIAATVIQLLFHSYC